MRVLVIQHGDKKREPGDPGLTVLGHEQAAAVAAAIEGMPVGRILCSPYRRARETAAPIEAALGMRATIDTRLRERMNWEGADQQPLEEFLNEWKLASGDRNYTPNAGDSSAAAGRRFVEVLDEQTAGVDDDAVIVVAHGGVTLDALRTLFGDRFIQNVAPRAISEGVPCGAITSLRWDKNRWTLERFGDDRHLQHNTRSAHRPA